MMLDKQERMKEQEQKEMAEMATERKVRKVRKEFNPSKKYGVDVSMCTEEEKKEVQQAFFDVGIFWPGPSDVYQAFYAVQYTNARFYRKFITRSLMYSDSIYGCNMSAKEFLDLVYEPEPEPELEKKGHVHARLMRQYAEDAETHTQPWRLWQIKTGSHVWIDCKLSPAWHLRCKYRRKPKTHIVNGVDIPDLRVSPEMQKASVSFTSLRVYAMKWMKRLSKFRI